MQSYPLSATQGRLRPPSADVGQDLRPRSEVSFVKLGWGSGTCGPNSVRFGPMTNCGRESAEIHQAWPGIGQESATLDPASARFGLDSVRCGPMTNCGRGSAEFVPNSP